MDPSSRTRRVAGDDLIKHLPVGVYRATQVCVFIATTGTYNAHRVILIPSGSRPSSGYPHSSCWPKTSAVTTTF
jgi:hypothetical protein